MMPQIEFIFKIYKRSKFHSTRKNVKVHGKKGDTCHHYKGDTWNMVIGNLLGRLYFQVDKFQVDNWVNCMMTHGIGEPMRGHHVVTSHWPILVIIC
jgi:hypothetical protein